MKLFRFLNKQEIYLTFQLTRSVFLSTDKNSFLGIFWHMLNPLLLSLVLLFVFGYKFHMNVKDYGFYILLGTVHFNFFAILTSNCSKALVQRQEMILNSVISKEVIIMAEAFESLFIFLIEITIVFGLMIIFGIKIHWSALYFPAIVVAQFMFSLGIALFLSIAVVFFRDFTYLWGLFVRALFFMVPIFYTLEPRGHSAANDLLRLNPLSQILILARDSLLYGTGLNPVHLGLLTILSAVTLAFGWIVFKFFEPYITDKIL